MATTTFTTLQTVITADWANDVDAIVYDIFSAATTAAGARSALGLDTGDSPTFDALTLTTGPITVPTIELGATDTTLSRASAGDIAVEGNTVYRSGGTDVAVTDGGTGISTALQGHISGLTLSNNGTDATNDIDIASGVATDDSNAAYMVLSASITKQLDAAWAVGTDQGGLDTGSIANDVYHVFLIRRSDTGVVDVLFSASASSPTMPANYDQKRRIGSIVRASAAIVLFTQRGDEFLLKTPITQFSDNNPGTSAVSKTITSIPDGIQVNAILRISIDDTSPAANTYVLVSSLDQTDTAPTLTVCSMYVLNLAGNPEVFQSIYLPVRTDTSAQIRYRLSNSDAGITLYGTLIGWIDTRGKDG